MKEKTRKHSREWSLHTFGAWSTGISIGISAWTFDVVATNDTSEVIDGTWAMWTFATSSLGSSIIVDVVSSGMPRLETRRLVLISEKSSFTFFLQSSSPWKKTPNDSLARSFANCSDNRYSLVALSLAPVNSFSNLCFSSLNFFTFLFKLTRSTFISIEDVTSSFGLGCLLLG